MLIHSLALEGRVAAAEPPPAMSSKQVGRSGPAECFIRITAEDYPTIWSVYQPKFSAGRPAKKVEAAYPRQGFLLMSFSV